MERTVGSSARRPPKGPANCSLTPKVTIGFEATPVQPASSSVQQQQQQQPGSSVGRRSPTSRSLLSELLCAAMEGANGCQQQHHHHGEEDDEDEEMLDELEELEDEELSEQEDPMALDEMDARHQQCSSSTTAVSIPATRRSNADAMARAIHAQQVQQLLMAQAKFNEQQQHQQQAFARAGGAPHWVPPAPLRV